MTDDPEILTVLAAMGKPTLFEYLSGCWKRERNERSALLQKKVNPLAQRWDNNRLTMTTVRQGMAPKAVTDRLEKLNEIKSMLVSYIGFVLDSPDMFPQASTSYVSVLSNLATRGLTRRSQEHETNRSSRIATPPRSDAIYDCAISPLAVGPSFAPAGSRRPIHSVKGERL